MWFSTKSALWSCKDELQSDPELRFSMGEGHTYSHPGSTRQQTLERVEGSFVCCTSNIQIILE